MKSNRKQRPADPAAPDGETNLTSVQSGIIIAGGGVRGLAFAELLTRELGRRVAAIAENDIGKHAHIAGFLHKIDSPDTRLFDSIESALKAIPRTEAKTLFVMTPEWTHVDVFRTAIKAGCHVFLEKPLATTRNDVLEILRLARSTDKTVQVGFVLRYSAFYRKVKSLINTGMFGKLVMIQMNERLSLRMGAGFCRSWHRKIRYTGGFINEKCCHDLDLMCWFKEDQAAPKEIISFGGRHFTPPRSTPETCGLCHLPKCPWRGENASQCVFHSDGDIMDHQCVNIRFADGTQGLFTATAMSGAPGRDLRIFGTDGYLEGTLESGEISVRDYWQHDALQKVSIQQTDGHGGGDALVVASFLDCVDRHEQPQSTVEDGVRASLMAMAADQSVKTRKMIPYPGIPKPPKTQARFPDLSGPSFNPNLVLRSMIRGKSRKQEFAFAAANPVGQPVNAVLRFAKGMKSPLYDMDSREVLPLHGGEAALTLRPFERRNLCFAGSKTDLRGSSVSIGSETADALKQSIENQLALLTIIETLDDRDVEEILLFAGSNANVEQMRDKLRRLQSLWEGGDLLSAANFTGGYEMGKLEAALQTVKNGRQQSRGKSGHYAIACGSTQAVKDSAGRRWMADQPWIGGLLPWGAVGGGVADRGDIAIQGTETPEIYRRERYGMEGYRFRLPNGEYRIRLHFAETYKKWPAARLFDVTVQGDKVLSEFDIFKTADGMNKAVVREFTAKVRDRMLAFAFTREAALNGIEIEPLNKTKRHPARSKGEAFQQHP